MTEKELLGAIIERARSRGWKVIHTPPVPVQRGGKTLWMTPLAADGKGFPDLLMVRDRVIVAEVKAGARSGNRHLSVDQKDWLSRFRMASAEAYVWTPEAWFDGTIDGVLGVRGPVPGGDPYLWESGT